MATAGETLTMITHTLREEEYLVKDRKLSERNWKRADKRTSYSLTRRS